jgi:uncharacterized cofD-like protein
MASMTPAVVVIGGGTGSFSVLSGLKNAAAHVTALVNMVDDGGSTGRLRDELGVLPPGDVRQCLVALSNSPKMRGVFNYRFEEGALRGHPFGNIFLSALEREAGSFAEAVETASEILNISGRVVPITLNDVRLVLEINGMQLLGQRHIEDTKLDTKHYKPNLILEPHAAANPQAIDAIMGADAVVIAPGDLYTSLGPSLIVDDIAGALRETQAKVIYVANLLTKHGQTDAFSANDYVYELERLAGCRFIDEVLYNDQPPAAQLLERYMHDGESVVTIDEGALQADGRVVIRADMVADAAWDGQQASDTLTAIRSYIRHDPQKTATQILARIQA